MLHFCVLRGRIQLHLFAKNVQLVCVVKSSNIEFSMESFIVNFLLVSKRSCRHLYFRWPNRHSPLISGISEVPVEAGNSHIHYDCSLVLFYLW